MLFKGYVPFGKLMMGYIPNLNSIYLWQFCWWPFLWGQKVTLLARLKWPQTIADWKARNGIAWSTYSRHIRTGRNYQVARIWMGMTWKFELHWILSTFLHPMMGLKLNCLINATNLKCWCHNFVAFQHMKCINHPLFGDEKLETLRPFS